MSWHGEEESDPHDRDEVQGPADAVKVVVARHLRSRSQTDGQGQTGHVKQEYLKTAELEMEDRQVNEQTQQGGDGDTLDCPGWKVSDTGPCSLLAPEIPPPFVATGAVLTHGCLPSPAHPLHLPGA